MVCKHCSYCIERAPDGAWVSYAKRINQTTCEPRHKVDGIWDHEPASEPFPVTMLLLIVLVLTLLLIAGVHAFGGLVR